MAAGLVVFFCLISSVFLTGVVSLKCQTCMATRGECRNEDMILMECEQDQTHCLSLTLRTTVAILPLSYTAKSCAKAEECNDGLYSVTTQGKYSQMNIFCCQSEGCNALPLPLPVRDELKPNGLVCPGSYTRRHGDSLLSTQPILCLGQETRCININFTTNTFGAMKEAGSLQGCATPSVCSFPDGEIRMANNLLVLNTTKECNTVPLLLDRAFLPM